MITIEQLKEILTDLESDRIELTESVSNTDKFSQAVCAFANDLPNHNKPGYLIIGARDNGTLTNIEVTDRLLRELVELRSNGNIQPLPQLNVNKFIINDCQLAVVEVFPSFFPPVRYKGRVFVRMGPRKDIASEQEERVLTEKRISKAKSFDSCAASESGLDDLSLPLFSSYRQQVISQDIIEANHRSIKDQLASLRFYDTTHDYATNAGLLVFGKNPRYFLPGAYVQYLKISGSSLTDPIADQAEISGDLLAVLRELTIRIKSQITSTLQTVDVLREKTLFEYPERALRELLMNAVMHRDYQSNAPIKFYWFSDHIEISSPGGLYGNVTIETMETASDYRNPVIAEAMKALDYVNKFGYGIQNAKASLKENGNPPAEFQCDGKVFRVLIKK